MADVKYIIEVDEKGGIKKIQDFDAAIKGLKGSSELAGPAASNMWKQFVAGGLILEGLKKGYNLLKGLVVDSIKGAMDEETAEKNLAAALDVSGRSRVAMMPGLMAFAMEMHNTTKYTHEQVQEAMAYMSSLTNLDSKGLQRATKGAIGLASVLKVDLHTAAGLVEKVLEGNVSVLGRYGIKVDETLPKEQQRALMMEKLVGFFGRATAETETFAGMTGQLGKSWDEAKEAIGGAIVKNEAIKKLIGEVKDKINELVKSGVIEEWATKGVNLLVKLAEGFGVLKNAIAAIPQGISGMGGVIADHLLGIDKALAKMTMDARMRAADFKNSLQVLKPSMEDIRKEFEKGPKAAKEYMDRMKGLDDQLVKNKGTVEAWVEKGVKFLGLQTELPPKINETGNALHSSAEKLAELAKAAGVVMTIDLEKKLADMTAMMTQYKASMPIDEQRKLEEEILKTKMAIAGANPLAIEQAVQLLKIKYSLTDLRGLFEDGAIGLDEFAKKMRAAIPNTISLGTTIDTVFKNIDTTLDTTTSDMGDSWDQFIKDANISAEKGLEKELPGHLQALPKAAEKTTRETKHWFDGLFNDIAQGFGNTVQKWMSGASTFKDFLKGLWGDVKNAFFRMVGEMATKWIVDFLGSLVKDTAKAAGYIAGSFGSALGGIGKTVGSIAGGLLSSLGSIGSIISGITSVISLLKGPQKQTDVTYWLKFIDEHLTNIWNSVTWWAPDSLQKLTAIFNVLVDTKDKRLAGMDQYLMKDTDYLKSIASYTKQTVSAIGELPHAGGGGYFAKPALVHLAERRPEWVLDKEQITNIYQSGAAAGPGPSIRNEWSVNFYITAMDARGIKETVQKDIFPVILSMIKNNSPGQARTNFQRELGLA